VAHTAFSLDTHSRYGYSTSPRRYSGAYIPSRRAPPDPRTFEFPATLKQYAEWFRYNFPEQAAEEDTADKVAELEAGDGSKPRNGIKARWEKYKKEFAATQVSSSLSLPPLLWMQCYYYVFCVDSIFSPLIYCTLFFLIAHRRQNMLKRPLHLYCSFKRCLNIIESPLGSLKNTTHHQTWKVYACA